MAIITPYDQAWHAYHADGSPTWSWEEIIGAHFRCGAVIATADAFILARRVNYADPDWFHLSPLQWRAEGDCWMVWAAAGNLEAILGVARAHSAEWVSYQRRDSFRVRRVKLERFLRHDLQATQDSRAACCSSAGKCHRPGESPGGSR